VVDLVLSLMKGRDIESKVNEGREGGGGGGELRGSIRGGEGHQ
jgi:hypothetical protein